MEVRLVPMRSPRTAPWAGAYSSDGWEVVTPWHLHDMHQLLYAFEGSVEVEGRSAHYKVPRQFAIWIPAGTIHRTAIHKVRSGSVFFSPDLVECPAGSPRVICVPKLMREMIMYSMRWPLDRPADQISASYFDCFAKLCAEWTSHEVNLILPASADERIDAIMSFTRRHIANVNMYSICHAFGMSERSLRRHFSKSVGMTWEEFRQRLRIYVAIDALDHTTRSVGSIAADVGYASQAAFAKKFRLMMGMGPTEYRRSMR